jgi:hypothetical protein
MDKPTESVAFSLPPEIRQSLGDIIIGWSRVEALLAEFLSFLLKADRGAMYVLNQDIASSTQLKWIRTLAAERYPDAQVQAFFSDLFERIDDARRERNGYAHGLWGPGTEPGTVRVQTAKLDRAEIIREQLVTRSDLDDLFGDIESVGDALYRLGTELGFIE